MRVLCGTARHEHPRRRVLVGVVLIVLASLAGGPPAAAAPPDDDCAPVMPVSEVRAGMRGTGYTVAAGTTREAFGVEVLGVLENADGVGRDLILVELSGPLIDRVGGAWFGISGSPVYIGDRLLGSPIYLMSGSSRVTALRPAEEMLEVLTLPTAASATATSDDTTRRTLANTTTRTASEVQDAALTSMPVPLGVSGLSSTRVGQLRRMLSARGLPYLPYVASTAAGEGAASTAVRPGDNLVAAIAYGDVSFSGAGTTTYVCDGQALAFGHPMLYSGPSGMGASTGESVALVTDPVWGSFELVRTGALIGTIDQDRMAGLRISLGQQPTIIPITSVMENDDTGRSRRGRTDALLSDWVPDVAMFHGLANLDRVLDRYGKGSSSLDVTVEGRTEDGTPFTYRRSNVFASDVDVTWDTLVEFYSDLSILVRNGVEPVRFTGIDLRGTVRDQVERYTLRDVAYSLDGVDYLPLDGLPELYLPAGAVLHLRVTLDPATGANRTVDVKLEVPADLVGPAALEVLAGPGEMVDPSQCVFDPNACPVTGDIESIADLVDALQRRPRNDDLLVRLSLFGGDMPVDGDMPPEAVADGVSLLQSQQEEPPVTADATTVEVRTRQDQPVTGFFGIPVFVEPSGDGEGPQVQRLAGADRVGTAIAVARSMFPEPGMTDTVVLARADDLTDALTGAPLAARRGAPLLLTGTDQLPSDVATEIRRLGVTRAMVLGGTRAVGDTVVAALEDAGLERVERVAGTDRYDTARLIALRVGGDRAVLARGTGGFVDAVAASGLAAQQGRPLLLTDGASLPAPTRRLLEELGVGQVVVAGGTAAVAPAVTRELAGLGITVDRVAGGDRYGTSAELARLAISEGADASQLFVATGRAAPDGLVAAAAAGQRGGVLLLVEGRSPDGSAAARLLLADVGAPAVVTSLTVVGGAAAISDAVVADLVSALPEGGGPTPPAG